MATIRQIWLVPRAPNEALRQVEAALCEMGANDVKTTDSSVAAETPRSLRHNHWAAQWRIEASRQNGTTTALAVSITQSGTRAGYMMGELVKRIPPPVTVRDAAGRAPRIVSYHGKTGGVDLFGDRIAWKVGKETTVVNFADHEVGALVDSAGAIDKRVTATRLILTGPFAFGMRKKKDNRQLYLMLESSSGHATVIECDPEKGQEARSFAAQVNATAKAAHAGGLRASAAPVGAMPMTDPDPADQIQKLAELKDQGILTEEEFAAKKAQLLDRM